MVSVNTISELNKAGISVTAESINTASSIQLAEYILEFFTTLDSTLTYNSDTDDIDALLETRLKSVNYPGDISDNEVMNLQNALEWVVENGSVLSENLYFLNYTGSLQLPSTGRQADQFRDIFNKYKETRVEFSDTYFKLLDLQTLSSNAQSTIEKLEKANLEKLELEKKLENIKSSASDPDKFNEYVTCISEIRSAEARVLELSTISSQTKIKLQSNLAETEQLIKKRDTLKSAVTYAADLKVYIGEKSTTKSGTARPQTGVRPGTGYGPNNRPESKYKPKRPPRPFIKAQQKLADISAKQCKLEKQLEEHDALEAVVESESIEDIHRMNQSLEAQLEHLNEQLSDDSVQLKLQALDDELHIAQTTSLATLKERDELKKSIADTKALQNSSVYSSKMVSISQNPETPFDIALLKRLRKETIILQRSEHLLKTELNRVIDSAGENKDEILEAISNSNELESTIDLPDALEELAECTDVLKTLIKEYQLHAVSARKVRQEYEVKKEEAQLVTMGARVQAQQAQRALEVATVGLNADATAYHLKFHAGASLTNSPDLAAECGVLSKQMDLLSTEYKELRRRHGETSKRWETLSSLSKLLQLRWENPSAQEYQIVRDGGAERMIVL